MANYVSELMEKVKMVYQGASSLHSISTHRLVFLHDHGKEELEYQCDLWLKKPKLRVECKCLTCVPRGTECTQEKILIWDGEYEYRFVDGKWSKMKGSPNLLELHGLFEHTVYETMEEQEVDGHPVWVVHGRVTAGILGTWWIDKETLTVRRFAFAGSLQHPFIPEPSLKEEISFTAEILKCEIGVAVEEEKFSTPANIPLVENPLASVLEELARLLGEKHNA